ncbi:MAG: archaeosortase/exosortase family protein [Pseudanabaenaceae cyanobacterium bins.68]|nr:archaeosortase/exosortase family protein [Pseudanabaenaceae cyanobacterium bins.68]
MQDWQTRWGAGFWLLACGAAIATFHLNLIWQQQITIGQSAVTNLVGWGVILYLLWQKRHLPLPELAVPRWLRVTGLMLLGWMILRAWLRRGSLEIISIFFPLVAFTGLLLVAVGWQGLKSYRWEFMTGAFLSMPLGSVDFIGDALKIPLIDARLAAFTLHYLGFEVARQGNLIFLPGGAVEIASSCSSFSTIISLLILVFAFLIVFPVPSFKQLVLVVGTICSVLVVNSGRMALLAVLVAEQQKAAFDYWHGTAGAEVFSNISIFVIAGWGYLLLRPQPELPEEEEPELLTLENEDLDDAE